METYANNNEKHRPTNNNKFTVKAYYTSLCACRQPSNFKSHKNSHISIHFMDVHVLFIHLSIHLSIDSPCMRFKAIRTEHFNSKNIHPNKVTKRIVKKSQ